MIAFADDLTGAAEIGGVAWRYGLSSVIAINQAPEDSSGLAIIDAETRSMDPPDAVENLRRLSRWLGGAELFFFKIDSALRGPVVPQVRATMRAQAVTRALIAPANPTRGRTIKDGIYLIEGVPIAETEFVGGPGHPARSSRIRDLLPGAVPLRPWQEMGEVGLFVGQAETPADVRHWAHQVDELTLAAGAADLFAALLECRGRKIQSRPPVALTGLPHLLISGTASRQSRLWYEARSCQGLGVLRLPQRIIDGDLSERLFDRWTNRAAANLRERQWTAMITGRPVTGAAADHRFTARLAAGAAAVIEPLDAGAIFIEGGATAAAVAANLGWNLFDVLGELAPGLVVLSPRRNPRLRFILKPGSYPWPAAGILHQ
ncbi:MAG: hypothetical protein IT160_05970 [Bryobacterales bacterium]|nr:hypothetical protein [Bryobacterales bacterium]